MEISLATATDIPALCQLLNLLFTQEQEFAPDEAAQSHALLQIIENPDIGHIFAARENGGIVGMVSLLYTISTALGGKVALLEDMIVASDVRNKGIGSQLLEYALDFAKRQRCLRVTALSDAHNQSAHRFYQRHGFKRSDMIPLRLLTGISPPSF